MMQLARTTLAQERVIDIFAPCMTKIDNRKEAQSLRTEMNALDTRIAKRAMAALCLKVASRSHCELASTDECHKC